MDKYEKDSDYTFPKVTSVGCAWGICVIVYLIVAGIILFGWKVNNGQNKTSKSKETTTTTVVATTVKNTTTTPITTTTIAETTTTQKITTTKPEIKTQVAMTENTINTYKSSATKIVSTEEDIGDKKWIEFNCSAYCTCTTCTGGGGTTASGTAPQANWTIAASRNYPFGTLIYIEGYGTYCVEDRGGAITNNKLDLYFATHQEACNFGRQYLKGYVVRWGYGDG